jgi:hypothetical protein
MGERGYHDEMFLMSSSLRRWVLLAIAVPVVSWLLAKAADRMSRSRGESNVTKTLRAPQNWRLRRKAA